ncbi:putative quinol monooxygenase [Pseudonocardia nigra]|uniref:putative quinol monooxygenase n=1 Tax=Pseudonocardia nigra TaxID=1921578 RepID=UPI001C5F0066|nr:putative quinol monooxygenase [Pseudonocardia nigra]
MSIPTDENRELLTVVATMRALAGREADLKALLESVVEPTRGEDGCVTYALHQGVADPAVFVFYENWTSQAHLDKHLASPHITSGLAGLPELLDGELTITALRRVA